MTCIVGFIEGKTAYIGGDTFGSDGRTGCEVFRSKVFKVGNFVIGGTSSFRMLDLLEFSFEPRNPYPDDDMDKYMRTIFVNAVRGCLSSGGFKTVENNVESGGNFLVAYKDNLWEIQNDFSVLNRRPYSAVGSGEQVAIGSLYTTEKMKLTPKQKITFALEAACKHVVSVRGPYTILNT